MKWMLVTMCMNGWTMVERWCDPIQIFADKAQCESVQKQLDSGNKYQRHYCVPEDKK